MSCIFPHSLLCRVSVWVPEWPCFAKTLWLSAPINGHGKRRRRRRQYNLISFCEICSELLRTITKESPNHHLVLHLHLNFLLNHYSAFCLGSAGQDWGSREEFGRRIRRVRGCCLRTVVKLRLTVKGVCRWRAAPPPRDEPVWCRCVAQGSDDTWVDYWQSSHQSRLKTVDGWSVCCCLSVRETCDSTSDKTNTVLYGNIYPKISGQKTTFFFW